VEFLLERRVSHSLNTDKESYRELKRLLTKIKLLRRQMKKLIKRNNFPYQRRCATGSIWLNWKKSPIFTTLGNV
jgi:hypothetical protein